MAATSLQTSQIKRPIRGELELLERELEHMLKSDLGLVQGIGEHLLAIKGKRVRPILLFLSSHVGEPDAERSVKAAVAIELIHTATLLHDDSIDKSHLRRGLPTVNKLWDEQVSVIMGDHLFCKAFTLLHETGLKDIAQVMVKGSDRMTFGEMYQMDKRGDCEITEKVYLDLIRHKTASLFSCSCEAGAMIGGIEAEARKSLVAYGETMGIAFQIIDDVLDFVGDVERMGKPVGNDVRDGRVTLPLIAALRNAGPEEVARVKSFVCGSEFTQDGWEHIVAFVEENGGIEYSRDLCGRLADEAKGLISDLPECPAKTSLTVLADYVISRQK
jgi:octaprenyl-diphosphate synthase